MSFQLNVFITVVREIMGRDKKGKYFWVEARKKPSRKSQTLKNSMKNGGEISP